MSDIPDKAHNALLTTVMLFQSSRKMEFPFKHRNSGATETIYNREFLVPAGLLSMSDCDHHDTCYEITRAGYELIREWVGDDLRKQGDEYYRIEVES